MAPPLSKADSYPMLIPIPLKLHPAHSLNSLHKVIPPLRLVLSCLKNLKRLWLGGVACFSGIQSSVLDVYIRGLVRYASTASFADGSEVAEDGGVHVAAVD